MTSTQSYTYYIWLRRTVWQLYTHVVFSKNTWKVDRFCRTRLSISRATCFGLLPKVVGEGKHEKQTERSPHSLKVKGILQVPNLWRQGGILKCVGGLLAGSQLPEVFLECLHGQEVQIVYSVICSSHKQHCKGQTQDFPATSMRVIQIIKQSGSVMEIEPATRDRLADANVVPPFSELLDLDFKYFVSQAPKLEAPMFARRSMFK